MAGKESIKDKRIKKPTDFYNLISSEWELL